MVNHKPSDLFKRYFTFAGSCMETCEFCETTYYCNDQREFDWEEGEFEDLVKKEKENPDKFKGHPHSIPHGVLLGKDYTPICGCQGSEEFAYQLEQFLLRSSNTISDFYNAFTSNLESRAKEKRNIADKLSKSVGKL